MTSKYVLTLFDINIGIQWGTKEGAAVTDHVSFCIFLAVQTSIALGFGTLLEHK